MLGTGIVHNVYPQISEYCNSDSLFLFFILHVHVIMSRDYKLAGEIIVKLRIWRKN